MSRTQGRSRAWTGRLVILIEASPCQSLVVMLSRSTRTKALVWCSGFMALAGLVLWVGTGGAVWQKTLMILGLALISIAASRISLFRIPVREKTQRGRASNSAAATIGVVVASAAAPLLGRSVLSTTVFLVLSYLLAGVFFGSVLFAGRGPEPD
jgi:predicted secreted protein